ncbi:MAG: septum formation initiator family protein [Dehalococcoidia bacterium]
MALSTARRSRLIFGACALVAAYFIYTAAAGAVQGHRLSEDQDAADRSVANLEAKKAYLEAVKQYVSSDAYVEQEARRRLGYIRDGEVPFSVLSPGVEPEEEPEGEWWQRLFPR